MAEDLNKIKLEAARTLKDTLLQGGIDKPPEFFKPYSLLNKPQTILKANLLLPLDAIQTNKLTSIQIFDEPYNNIQKFTFNPMTKEMQLTFVDKTSDIADMLLFSFLEQGRRGVSGGAGQIEIEFGWRRPDSYRIPKRIEDKTQWTIKRIFTLTKPEYKFLPGMAGVEVTLKGNASSLNMIPGLEKLKPYFIFGNFPLVDLVKELVMEELIVSAEKLTIDNIEKMLKSTNSKKAVFKNNKGLEKLLNIIQKKLGATTKDQQSNLLRSLLKMIRGNKQKFTEIQNSINNRDSKESKEKQEKFNSFYKKLEGISINLQDFDLGSVGPLNIYPKKNAKISEGEKEFIKFISPVIGEIKIHPMNAFLYFYGAMKDQIESREDSNQKVKLFLTSFLKPEQIKGALLNNKRTFGKAGDFKDDDAKEFILAKDLQINSGTSWESLFDDILKKVNLTIGDPKLRGKSPLRAGSHMIYAKNSTSTLKNVNTRDAGTSGDLIENNATVIDDILKNIRLLSKVNGEAKTERGAELKGTDKYINQVITFANDNKDTDLLFTLIGPKDPGVIFSNISISNKVVQGYSYRPYIDNNSLMEEFWTGRSALQENNFPDVINFEPEFNFWEASQAIVRNSQLQESITLGKGLLTKSVKEESMSTNIDKANKDFKDDYLSTKYKISTNMLQQASFITIGGRENADAEQAKNALQNLRTRLGLSSLNIKAKLTILGEPSFTETLTNNCYIFLKIINADGTESFLSGLWAVIKVLSHDLAGGQYTTLLEITKAKGDANDKLGYSKFIKNRDAQIITKS